MNPKTVLRPMIPHTTHAVRYKLKITMGMERFPLSRISGRRGGTPGSAPPTFLPDQAAAGASASGAFLARKESYFSLKYDFEAAASKVRKVPPDAK